MKLSWIWYPWILFLLLAGGWAAYWHIVADTAEQRFSAALAAQNERGGQASFARIVRHGFPTLMRLEIQDIAYAPARGGWRAETPRADLHIQLLDTDHVIFSAEAPITLTRASGAITIVDAEAMIASVRSRGSTLVQAGVEARALTLDDPDKEGVLSARTIVANLRRDPRAESDYQLAFEAQDLVLPRPVRSFEGFGQDVSAIRAAIVLEQAATLTESAEGDPLGPWREAGGQMRFEALALNWGPLEATGSGHGGLDEERRIQGVLTLPIERPGPIFSAIAQAPNLNQNTRQALTLLAAGYAISGDDITLDVEAHNGVLRLEGLSVRGLPPVY